MRFYWPADILKRVSQGDARIYLESLEAFARSPAGKLMAKLVEAARAEELEALRGMRRPDDPKQGAYQMETQGKLDVLEALAAPGLGAGEALAAMVKEVG